MRMLVAYIAFLVIIWAGAHAVAYYIPEDATGYAGFLRNVADYVLSAEEWLKQNIKEPIQWVIMFVGFLIFMHGIRSGSGILALIGANIVILGIAWQVAKQVYNVALEYTGNPLFAVLAVALAGIAGSSLVKKWLAK